MLSQPAVCQRKPPDDTCRRRKLFGAMDADERPPAGRYAAGWPISTPTARRVRIEAEL